MRETLCLVLVAAVSLDPGGGGSLSARREVLIHTAALGGKDKETWGSEGNPRGRFWDELGCV